MYPKKQEKEKKNAGQAPDPEETRQEEEETGGFPDRDLRKNLGCG